MAAGHGGARFFLGSFGKIVIDNREGEGTMLNKHLRFHVGMRTVKTALAVIIAMVLVDIYGASASKLIFAMLGAMAAVQPTFKESWESCLTQIVGVLFGALMGILLRHLPLHWVITGGVGVLLVITLYNTFGIRFSPGLPCLITVMLCVTPDIQTMQYASERIWDTAIGLAVGMAVNMLVFPYDNSRRIRNTAESLDRELIAFLEELFDGDTVIPDGKKISQTIGYFDSQLKIFANQKLLLRKKSKSRELENFRTYEGKARELLARMEVLSYMERPGRLDDENRQKLAACGACIRDERPLEDINERDVVTNYHVRQILRLRQELLEVLQ